MVTHSLLALSLSLPLPLSASRSLSLSLSLTFSRSFVLDQVAAVVVVAVASEVCSCALSVNESLVCCWIDAPSRSSTRVEEQLSKSVRAPRFCGRTAWWCFLLLTFVAARQRGTGSGWCGDLANKENEPGVCVTQIASVWTQVAGGGAAVRGCVFCSPFSAFFLASCVRCVFLCFAVAWSARCSACAVVAVVAGCWLQLHVHNPP